MVPTFDKYSLKFRKISELAFHRNTGKNPAGLMAVLEIAGHFRIWAAFSFSGDYVSIFSG